MVTMSGNIVNNYPYSADFIFQSIPEFPSLDHDPSTAPPRPLVVDERELNRIDPLQKALHKRKKNEIELKLRLLVNKSLKVNETNITHFLDLVNAAVRYYGWKKDCPVGDEKTIFLMFLTVVLKNTKPIDKSEDIRAIFIWRQVANHILDGELPKYASQLWSEIESRILRFSIEQSGIDIWDGLTKDERLLADEFEEIASFVIAATPDIDEPLIWQKISSSLFPLILRCMKSVLIHDLIEEPSHPQHQLTMTCLAATYNFLRVGGLELSERQQVSEICWRIINSQTKTGGQHMVAIEVLSMCFTAQEVKYGLISVDLADADIQIMVDGLKQTTESDCEFTSFHNIKTYTYEIMSMINRFCLCKDNLKKLLDYGSEEQIDLAHFFLKGVESKDKRVQLPTMEILKVISEESDMIDQLRASQHLLTALEIQRASPYLRVKQMATEILLKIRIKHPNRLKVTMERLEKSKCVKWTELEFRQRISECGFTIPVGLDTTGCDGEWLTELLAMRREIPNTGYYQEIESTLGIEASHSVPFNKCMRRIEQLFLSDDGTRDADPYDSIRSSN